VYADDLAAVIAKVVADHDHAVLSARDVDEPMPRGERGAAGVLECIEDVVSVAGMLVREYLLGGRVRHLTRFVPVQHLNLVRPLPPLCANLTPALPNAHENLADGATFIDGSDGRRGLVERESRSYDWV
jgi:hypothetical protein